MLSYYIIDLGYAANLFFIMTILLSYKRSRRTLPLAYLLCVVLYVILDFICLTEIPGVSMQISFILAGFFEMFATFFVLSLFTSGNIWRSYSMMIFSFVLLNALSSMLVSLNARLDKIYAGYIVNGPVPVKVSFVLAIIMLLSGLIVTLIMSRFIKKEYKGNGRIYMIFSFLYTIIGIVQMIFKQNTIIDGLEGNGGTGISRFVYIVIGVTTFYVFGLLHYHYEGKRLAKENEKLTEYIRGNDERYQKLVSDNQKMSNVKVELKDYSKEIDGDKNQDYKEEICSLVQEVDQVSLTGNLVIDAIIKNNYQQAKEAGISYEVIPGHISFSEDKIINFATIVENILLIAKDFAKDAGVKWMYLSFRQNGDMILFKSEFSKSKRSKLSADGNIFAKPTVNSQRLKLIKSLCETMYGTTSIVNDDEESCISVLVNNG